MSRKHLIAGFIGFAALASGVIGASIESARASKAGALPIAETSIPFASRDGIQDYKADGDRGLYIRGINGNWYYARTLGNCPRLNSADVIGFETSAADQLDKFGALRAQGWRCPLASLVRSAPPPRKAKSRG
ncbi:hypothetical protein [Sphingobium boeckii]|uniref:Uncharacterized protein n=1 Tax=Sphingobium boeckii TaxID=1082345 RepID=A0A7W9AF90_9SPHN|nr:hypothetical protein [Sphingobium boeckii]MBB5684462.1 hypothetical protein [Sphingobium boeckii]